jgi:selenocysteine lyase/cysteine desulfurase
VIFEARTRAVVDRLRQETAGCENVIHLNNAGSSLPPRTVVERTVRHLRAEESVGGYEAAEAVREELEAGYRTFAHVMGAEPGEIAVTDSATRSWLAVFTALPLRQGDRILTAAPEYSSNIIAMRAMAEARGVRVEVVASVPSGEIDLDALRETLDDDVRLVAITHAPTNGGLLQPVGEIGALVAESPAVYLVDACQSIGQVPLDMAAIGADAVTVTGRKYLRAPRGTGVLAVRRGLLERLTPVHLDLYGAQVAGETYRLRDDARRFEMFERNVAAVLGMGEAARYYLEVGQEWARGYIRALAEYLRFELGRVTGVTVTDLGSRRSGIVSFRSNRVAARPLAATLRERGINVSVSQAPSTPWDMGERGLDELVRASVHYYNTPEEVARLCDEVEKATG